MLRNSDKGARNRARSLRKRRTLPERLLWNCLNDNQIGFRLLSQHPVGNYVLDFFIPEALMCIEIDGGKHKFRLRSDQLRDQALAELGIQTLRLSARWVLADAYGCAVHIRIERIAALGE